MNKAIGELNDSLRKMCKCHCQIFWLFPHLTCLSQVATPWMEAPHANRCCLCVPLKTGGYLIAVGYVGCYVLDFFSNFAPQIYSSTVLLNLYIGLAILFACGIWKTKPKLLIPYIVLFVTKTLTIPFLWILQAVTAYRHIDEDNYDLRWKIIDFALLALLLMMSAYHLVVIFRLYVILRTEEAQGNKLFAAKCLRVSTAQEFCNFFWMFYLYCIYKF